MPDSFDYAVVRAVPRVERGEAINVGVILFARRHRFLGARVAVDSDRLAVLDPGLDIPQLERQLALIPLVCSGDPAGGPIAGLQQAERFHWLVSPRSTIIQVSPVHTGLCDDPVAALDRLFQGMVLPPGGPA
jgi:hypothetical protein